MNDQVELVRRAPDLNDLELGASHHADMDAVAVTHVGFLVVRHDVDQLACPLGEQCAEQLDEHGLLVSGRVAVEMWHGDEVQVVQDAVHADMDADVEERHATVLAIVKRQRKRPHVVVGHDVADDSQGVGN